MKHFLLLAFLQVVCLWAPEVRAQEDILCAVVVIEIEQEATFERQGFQAKMAITNALDTFSLEDVTIDVIFRNADGELVEATSNTSSETASFFITVASQQGITALDGTGVIAPNSAAHIEWLIVPAPGAADTSPNGTLYYVGAEISYRYGNEQDSVTVAPDTIVVKPMPELVLDYFLTEEVIADDPFTTLIEPPVPYTLGMRAVNNGAGTARDFRISSSQPRIVENEQGLAIAFEILGSFVGNQPVQPTLNVTLGDVPADAIRTARWIMQSSLSGKFIDFSATYTHAESLGGSLTSLIQAVNTHILVKDVLVDRPGRDGVRDYLVRQGNGFLVFESESTGAQLPVCDHCLEVPLVAAQQTSTALPGNGLRVDVTVGDAPSSGPVYHRIQMNPLAGRSVTAAYAGSTRLPLANVWVSQERDENKVDFNYFLNILAFEPHQAYQITIGQKEEQGYPPVFQAVLPRQVTAGSSVGFLVQASGPGEGEVVLQAESAPLGSSFTVTSNGQAEYLWQVPEAFAGSYVVVFKAANVYGENRLAVPITVLPADTEVDPELDSDGDGIPDVMEILYGTDPFDADDAGLDSDGDEYSLLEEYLAGSDPNDPTSTPITVAYLFWQADTGVGLAQTMALSAESAQGQDVYILRSSNRIYHYKRQLPSGALEEVGYYPVSYNSGVMNLSQGENYLYIYGRYGGSAYLEVLRRDTLSGELRTIQTLRYAGDTSLGIPGDIEVSPDGNFVYLVSNNSHIHVFGVNAVGLLEHVQTVNANVGGITVARSIALDQSGIALFVAGTGGLVALYRDASSGELSGYAASTYVGANLNSVVVHPETGILYVSSNSFGLREVQWRILGATFEELNGAVVGAGNGGSVSANGRLLYTYGGSASVGLGVYGPDVRLGAYQNIDHVRNNQPDKSGHVVTLGFIQGLFPSTDGRHVYVISGNNVLLFRHDRFWDLDGDGIPDHLDPDIDGDGVPNETDAFPYDPSEWLDTDGDGYGDNVDAFPNDPLGFRDSNGNGIPDYQETDADGDGIPDAWELQWGLDPRNPLDASLDQDNDGLTNLQEYQYGTNPHAADTDGDGGLDGDEVAQGTDPTVSEPWLDSTGNGCLNAWMMEYSYDVYDPAQPGSADADDDGLTDMQECQAGSDPFVSDTDGDGVSDYIEGVDHNTDPGIHRDALVWSKTDTSPYGWRDAIFSTDTGRGRYAYLLRTHNQLVHYYREMPSGDLTELNVYTLSSFQNGTLSFAPDEEYLYVAGSQGSSGNITVMRRDGLSGALTLVQSVLYAGEIRLSSLGRLSVSEDGRFIYVPSGNLIHVFEVNEVGHLEHRQTTNVQHLGSVGTLESVALSLDNEYLYIGSSTGLSVVARDPLTGELGAVVLSSLPMSSRVYGIAVHPTTGTAYLSVGVSGYLKAVAWNAASSVLQEIWSQGQHGVGQYASVGSDERLLYSLSGQPAGGFSVFGPDIVNGAIQQIDLVRDGYPSHTGIVLDVGFPKFIKPSSDGRHVYAGDSDGNLFYFRHDRFWDLDGDGIRDDLDPDIDGDGVSNEADAFPYDSSEWLDTDGDGYGDNVDAFPNDPLGFRDSNDNGIPDYQETDADGDGLPDVWELQWGLDPRNPLDALLDQDNDGLTNLQEYQYGTNPHAADTDGDGGLDGDEVAQATDPTVSEPWLDSTGNGCLNAWMMEYGYNVYDPAQPGSADADGDGLTDMQECQAGSNPFVSDTDGDGISDYIEVNDHNTNPGIHRDALVWSKTDASSYGWRDEIFSTDAGRGRYAYLLRSNNQLIHYYREMPSGNLTEQNVYTLSSTQNGSLHFSPDEEYLYIAGWQGSSGNLTVMRRDAVSGALEFVQSVLYANEVRLSSLRRLSVSEDSRFIYVPSGNLIHVFEVNEVGHLEHRQTTNVQHLGSVGTLESVALSLDSEYLYIGSSTGLSVVARDPLTGELGAAVLSSLPMSSRVYGIAVHPTTGTAYLSVGGSGYLKAVTWDAASSVLQETGSWGGHGVGHFASFSGDERLLYSLSGQPAGGFSIFGPDIVNGAIQQIDLVRDGYPSHTGMVLDIGFPKFIKPSPDGRHVYAADSDGNLFYFRHDRFWDLDGDGIRDDLDSDIDGDGVSNEEDMDPYDPDVG